jgi:hypothetical protein
LKGRTLDRARHRYLERWNDRRVISKIGKGRNCERTRADWGRNRGERRGGRGRLNVKSPDALCVKLSYHSWPSWPERRSSCLSSFVPRREGPKWSVARVLPGCHWVVEAKAMRKWYSMVVILTMQSCVTHGTNFQDPRL